MSIHTKAAYKVISVLNGRKGFDDWWDAIFEEDQQEIIDEISALLAKHYGGPDALP